MDDPSIKPALQRDQPSVVKTTLSLINALFGERTETVPAEEPPATLSEDDKLNRAVEELLDNMMVITRTNSNVIVVRYADSDPERAALVANTAVETYIADRQASDDAAAERANEFLERTLNELRAGVEQAEQEIVAFREDSGLLGLGGLSVIREKVVQLANQAIRARADRALAEARMIQAERLLLSAPEDDASQGLQSGLVNELKFQETNILRRIADLKTRFREQHPSVIAARDELQEIQRAIRDEVRKIVIGYENELQVARQREREVDAELGDLEQQIARQNAAEVQLESLKEAAVSARDLYEKALERLNIVQLRDDVTTDQDIRVISNAVVPEEPFAPRKASF